MVTKNHFMEIGTKIRKIRELKGFSQENIANDLEMSITGYGKIERNEVSINYDKLQKIAQILKVDVETIIGFDDKVAFNNFNSKINQQIGQYYMSNEMKQLYEDKIKLLEEKTVFLENKIIDLQSKHI